MQFSIAVYYSILQTALYFGVIFFEGAEGAVGEGVVDEVEAGDGGVAGQGVCQVGQAGVGDAVVAQGDAGQGALGALLAQHARHGARAGVAQAAPPERQLAGGPAARARRQSLGWGRSRMR